MGSDDQPELRGMIRLRKVGEFVDHDIVQDGGWGHHQPPVEAGLPIVVEHFPTNFRASNLKSSAE